MAGTPTKLARRYTTRAAFLLALIVASFSPHRAHAQSARASFFIQMLRQNPDTRVRMSAALRLGELREAATVDSLGQIYAYERDPAVQAAIVSTLASIGDPRALPTVQVALRSGSSSVVNQARRALTVLQAAASRNNPPENNGFASSSASARFLIGVGSVNNQSGNSQLVHVAQQALQQALQQRPQVFAYSGSPTGAANVMRSRNLRGHYFDANIQSVQPRAGGVRAAVSIAVSTYPGRAFEFDYQSAITITGGSGNDTETQADAVRRAVESAVNHAVDQLARSP